jgi:hypothetical protein
LQREVTNRIQQALKFRNGIFAQPTVNFVPLGGGIVVNGAAKRAVCRDAVRARHLRVARERVIAEPE